MSTDYWLGVATVPAVIGAAYALIWAVTIGGWHLGQRGWFMETGLPPRENETTRWNDLRVRGGWGLWFGLYRTRSGWGSRWVAIGPLTIGHKSRTLALPDTDRA